MDRKEKNIERGEGGRSGGWTSPSDVGGVASAMRGGSRQSTNLDVGLENESFTFLVVRSSRKNCSSSWKRPISGRNPLSIDTLNDISLSQVPPSPSFISIITVHKRQVNNN